jgi:hypothetical protein
MEELHAENRRKYLRFTPNAEEKNDLQKRSVEAMAHIDLNPDGDTFEPTLMGLLGDQSHVGCSVVFVRSFGDGKELVKERICKVKAGALHPMRAVARWRADIDDSFFKVGFEFLE